MRKYVENVRQIKVMQEMKNFHFKSDFQKLLQNLGLSFLLYVLFGNVLKKYLKIATRSNYFGNYIF